LGITRGIDGYLHVRNRIYWRVFDGSWIQTNMPQAEVRRQKRASRRGMLIGFGTAVVLLLSYLFFGPLYSRYHQRELGTQTTLSMVAAYHQLSAYRDFFESNIELGLGGTTVPVSGSGALIFERPAKLSLSLKSSLSWPEFEVRLVNDAKGTWLAAPALNQYQVLDRELRQTPFDLPYDTAWQVGPMRILPVYRMLLAGAEAEPFLSRIHNSHYAGTAEVNGQPTYIIRWDQDAETILQPWGVTNASPDQPRIHVTAWVNNSNYMILRMKMDLSHWASQIMGDVTELPVTGLVLTESHRDIQTTSVPSSPKRFEALEPGSDLRRVNRLELPAPNFAHLTSRKRQFSRFIPQRLPQTPPQCIDLTEYYNAALLQTWHPGMPNNSLDVLPPGLLQLADVVYDVRGIIQLSGTDLRRAGGHYPEQINGVKIGQRCRQLHFLQASGWHSPSGTRVGSYVVHYSDGSDQVIPIVYGEDVRDWNSSGDTNTEITHGTMVWSAINNAGLHVRLFKTTWVNPMPEKEIASLDYTSAMVNAAPFLVAITADP
jgi:hypothetical protein